MYAPVLVTPPSIAPVSLDEAKLHLRVDGNDEDAVVEALILAATQHLDGWSGVLGRCLCEQTWRQDFDGFSKYMRLPLGPAISVASITWRNSDGQLATVASSNYLLQTDELGAFVRFDDGYSLPSNLADTRAVSVTYAAGYADIPAVPDDGETEDVDESVPARSTVPAPLKTAIILLAGHWYANREAVVTGTIATELPMAVASLISPYRRVGI
jgi:uncharacterized phiE125 gp8 family phage protein